MQHKPAVPESEVWTQCQTWARELGFSQIGVAGVDLSSAEPGFQAWLAAGFAGTMGYMHRHGLKRLRPAELLPGTVSVITARMNYLPRHAPAQWLDHEQQRLQQPEQAVVSVYARGRDYHKVLRQRLQQLALKLEGLVGPMGHRVFTDSAPVAEVELAQRSGLGWRGKHTLVLHRQAGSMFFLGEIFTSLPLTPTEATTGHCGQCSACIQACPTGAIVAPYRLDARRCISYLTIEHDGPIPEALRPLMGNRIYGCDDCQLACPWNKYATPSVVPDFDARSPWPQAKLLQLWAWTEAEFETNTAGTPIHRIGHTRWQRNLAVALGNALRSPPSGAAAMAHHRSIRQALLERRPQAHPLVAEHIDWALAAPGFDLR